MVVPQGPRLFAMGSPQLQGLPFGIMLANQGHDLGTYISYILIGGNHVVFPFENLLERHVQLKLHEVSFV